MGLIGTKRIVVAIAEGASLSDAISLKGYTVTRIDMPDEWTDAVISFQIDNGDGVFRDLFMDWGWEIVSEVYAGCSVSLWPFTKISHVNRLRIRSGTVDFPVAQEAEREIVIVAGVGL